MNDQFGYIETLSEIGVSPSGRRVISGTVRWASQPRGEAIPFTANGTAAERLAVIGTGREIVFDAYTTTENRTLPSGVYASITHCVIDAVKPRPSVIRA